MRRDDSDPTVELLFDENETRVLRWLFDDGLEAASILEDRALAKAIGALAPRIWNIRPGIETVLDVDEMTLLARAVSLGKSANGHLLSGNDPPSADLSALRAMQSKILGRLPLLH